VVRKDFAIGFEGAARTPAVREAAAFALPHPRLGETMDAAVVPRAGASVRSTELIAFASDRLASFQLPQHGEKSADALAVTSVANS